MSFRAAKLSRWAAASDKCRLRMASRALLKAALASWLRPIPSRARPRRENARARNSRPGILFSKNMNLSEVDEGAGERVQVLQAAGALGGLPAERQPALPVAALRFHQPEVGARLDARFGHTGLLPQLGTFSKALARTLRVAALAMKLTHGRVGIGKQLAVTLLLGNLDAFLQQGLSHAAVAEAGVGPAEQDLGQGDAERILLLPVVVQGGFQRVQGARVVVLEKVAPPQV